jgi:hypothetical protein
MKRENKVGGGRRNGKKGRERERTGSDSITVVWARELSYEWISPEKKEGDKDKERTGQLQRNAKNVYVMHSSRLLLILTTTHYPFGLAY